MKASDLRFKRTITDRATVKGMLSEDLTSIVYSDENQDQREVLIEDLLSQFVDEQIELTISVKDEEDLDIIVGE